jgi:hypothetical protein
MQYGNPVSDPLCGRCKQKIEMAVLTEAVYQDGIWLHTACHRAGADQRVRVTRLADGLQEGRWGMELLTSPLLQGGAPSRWHVKEG